MGAGWGRADVQEMESVTLMFGPVCNQSTTATRVMGTTVIGSFHASDDTYETPTTPLPFQSYRRVQRETYSYDALESIWTRQQPDRRIQNTALSTIPTHPVPRPHGVQSPNRDPPPKFHLLLLVCDNETLGGLGLLGLGGDLLLLGRSLRLRGRGDGSGELILGGLLGALGGRVSVLGLLLQIAMR